MNLYAQNILDHYKTPHYQKEVADATISHHEVNHSCGDALSIQLKVDGDRIKIYGFKGQGCAISMAAADMLGDLIAELSMDDILALTKEDLYEMLGIEISLRRSKCALLGLLAIQNAILEHQGGSKRSWNYYHI
ncbi:hypothetical protein COY07_02225 [Candidatus Peregrinibacteria bacterium CG_4_10_14_0_2_um_filter_43_11]|nr:MAG: hypothetical protein COY07_02225 [Candidatus Peregrinibacteria bacterium CG_4_10_14_0_2_um_filter_43_11]